MENKQEQIKKIVSKAAALEQGKEIAMAKELLDINEKQEETLQAIKDIPEAEPFPTKMRVELEGVNVITLKGIDGHTPTEDELQSLIKPLIPEPIKGDSYVLTKNDKVEIARSIKVPVVEKIIERTEVIKEQPIITNEIVEVAIHETPIEIKSKLETLEKEYRLDKKAIKGLETMDTAIEILDQRTQFLINKTSTSSGGGVSSLNSLTGAVTLSAGSNITLTPSGNDIEISSTGGGGSGWALTGNAGTTAGTNFVGTTDAQDLVFKVNTQEKLRLLNTGASNTDVAMVLGQITSGELSIKFREDQNETLQLYSTKSGTDMTTVVSNNASSTSILELAANGTSGYVRFTPTTAVEIRNRLPLRFWDSGNNYYAGFRAGGSMASDITWTLPSTDSTGTQALVSDGSGNLSWASISGGGGSGTVTSVAMSVPTGLTISGSPITTSGTLALTLTSGYEIPTTTLLEGLKVDFFSGLIETVVNGDYDIAINLPYGMKINSITTRSVSGSCTLTGYVDSTPLGGTANTVSSTETTQTHVSANTVTTGQDVKFKVTSNSDCLMMSFTIKYTRT